ncbi:hypothetical protein [Pseudarthrobacter sp. NamB4]|uniref:hypothetical protein n=1 Tax=Pseudarthrobacter sp. NamB4 TaxID=2576837 RepID=UPI0010FF5898|nr:hypothetical protein [Pseudarthrobacter sp. NamB4]TLM75342.1 hypothetical protein FDW81_01665 [Pseudarthrobacter sp. NamB4]
MAATQYDQFLQDATTCDPGSGASLGPDALYGLYTSWCHVTCQEPQPEKMFWFAMQSRIEPQNNGLRMKGEAAADYILSSYPALV